MIYLSIAFAFSGGLLFSALVWSEISRRRERKLASGWFDREEYLRKIATSERELLQRQLEREREMAAAERRELYSRIQAYDPNAGDFTPATPSIVMPPSRPGEETLGPRSFSEVELGQMGLVEQADGTIRDTRNDALFESVEDWRSWQADLKKRNLPENVHPEAVRDLGWNEALSIAKAMTEAKRADAKKAGAVAKN